MKEHLAIVLEAARKRGETCPHLLFTGPPGLGKTSLAHIVANEMGAQIRVTSGPALERAGDLVAILANLEAGDLLFVDEIHRLNRTVEEVLYPAMEDGAVDIVLGKGPAARTMHFQLQSVHARRRDDAHRHDHRPPARPLRLRVAARLLLDGRADAGRPAIGVPARRRHRAGRRARDRAAFARHAAHREPAAAPRPRLRAGAGRRRDHRGRRRRRASPSSTSIRSGLDRVDLAILRNICQVHGGGPVGVNTIAMSVGEEPETIEDVYEPYLVQQGFIARTPARPHGDRSRLAPHRPRAAAAQRRRRAQRCSRGNPTERLDGLLGWRHHGA